MHATVVPLGMVVSGIDYTTPPDGVTIDNIVWDFGDGETATGAKVNHLYDKAGTYNVTQTVTFSDGVVGQQTTPRVVELKPQLLVDGRSILYNLDANVFTESFAWNFGDGSNGSGFAGRHPYEQPGTYTITGSVSYKDTLRIDPFGPITVVIP